MPDLSTSRRGIRLILSMEGRSSARSSLGVHPPPARSNGLRNALGPYHFLSFHRLHNQPQALEPQAVREVFGTSRAREALRKLMRFLMSILDALSGIHAAIFSNFICARTKGDV